MKGGGAGVGLILGAIPQPCAFVHCAIYAAPQTGACGAWCVVGDRYMVFIVVEVFIV